jgi:hypothetical protein
MRTTAHFVDLIYEGCLEVFYYMNDDETVILMEMGHPYTVAIARVKRSGITRLACELSRFDRKPLESGQDEATEIWTDTQGLERDGAKYP